MKNKNLILFASLLTLMLQADDFSDFTSIDQVSIETKRQAQQPVDSWTFELENKTDTALYIQLFYDDSDDAVLPSGQGLVPAKQGGTFGYLRANGIDPRRSVTMYVWWKKDDIDLGRQVDLGRLLDQSDSKKYRANRAYTLKENPQRTSLLFAWQKGDPKLMPAKSSGVFSKKTGSGIPIKINITEPEIKKTIFSSDA